MNTVLFWLALLAALVTIIKDWRLAVGLLLFIPLLIFILVYVILGFIVVVGTFLLAVYGLFLIFIYTLVKPSLFFVLMTVALLSYIIRLVYTAMKEKEGYYVRANIANSVVALADLVSPPTRRKLVKLIEESIPDAIQFLEDVPERLMDTWHDFTFKKD